MILNLLVITAMALVPIADAHCPQTQYCFALDTRGFETTTDMTWKMQLNFVMQTITAISDMADGAEFAIVTHLDSTVLGADLKRSFSEWVHVDTLAEGLSEQIKPVGDVWNVEQVIINCKFSTVVNPALVLIQIGDFKWSKDENTAENYEIRRPGPEHAKLLGFGGAVATIGLLCQNSCSIGGLAFPQYLNWNIPTMAAVRALQDNESESLFGKELNTFCDAIVHENPLCQSGCPPTSVCYAIDESGNYRPEDFSTIHSMIIGISSLFQSYAPGSAFSAVGFSGKAHIVSTLTPSLEVLSYHLRNNKQEGGSTASGYGLFECAKLLSIMPENKVIVLLTDGKDNRRQSGVSIDDLVKDYGYRILTVGVGRKLQAKALKNIASGHSAGDRDLYTAVGDYSQLSNAVGAIVTDLCTASSMWTPTPEPPSCINLYCAQCGSTLQCHALSPWKLMNRKACDLLQPSFLCPAQLGKSACGQVCHAVGAVLIRGIKCRVHYKFPGYSEDALCENDEVPKDFAVYRVCPELYLEPAGRLSTEGAEPFPASIREASQTPATCVTQACSSDSRQCWPDRIYSNYPSFERNY